MAQRADGLSNDLNLELVLHSVLGDSVLELSNEAVTLLLGHVFIRWHFCFVINLNLVERLKKRLLK